MLHTDAFNKSNKNKMTKADYVKNAKLPGIPTEVLEVTLKQVTYTLTLTLFSAFLITLFLHLLSLLRILKISLARTRGTKDHDLIVVVLPLC